MDTNSYSKFPPRLFYPLIHTTYMHEYHPSDKADALTVSCVTVSHSISMEHPPQCDLTTPLLGVGKVGMGGERTTCVWGANKSLLNHMLQCLGSHIGYQS